MRIISGERRGKKLFALEGLDVRPTTDRVKEALFDILQQRVAGARFLDLFAGSGQIGLEAVSRGAALALLVEQSPAALKVVEKNVAATGFGDRVLIRRGDARGVLRGLGPRERFDLAFLDPPYRSGLLEECLPLAAARMTPEGVIVCEHPKEDLLPAAPEGFTLARTYGYGKIALSVYRREEEP